MFKIAYIGGSRGWAWNLMSDLAMCEDMSGDPLVTCGYENAKKLFNEMVMITKEYLTDYGLSKL